VRGIRDDIDQRVRRLLGDVTAPAPAGSGAR
jgi:hypothetical protein